MLRTLPLWFISGLCSTTLIASEARTEFDAAAAFGARQEVRAVSLSPDGKLLALVRTMPGRGERVEVVPVAGGIPQPIVSSAANQRLVGCDWVSDKRLVCRTYIVAEFSSGILANFSRTFGVDADGRNMRQLSVETLRSLYAVQNAGDVVDLSPGKGDGSILMQRRVVPENTVDTRLAKNDEGLVLEAVNSLSGTRRTLEGPRFDGVDFITDGYGTVRIIGEVLQNSEGYASDTTRYCYRLVDGRECLPLSRSNAVGGFNPWAVDRELNVAYGFDKIDGRQALFRVKLDGSLQRELVLADPGVDIDGLIRIGRQRRVVGATFANERRQIVMFDPQLKKLAAGLAKALPNAPDLAFIGASADESKLLLVASGDIEPGRYYLYDRKTRELNELVQARPELEGTKLAPVRPVSFKATDGVSVPGYLTLPPGSDGKGLPAIVLPHGGPGARDEWGFDWLAQFFANRGFAVLQPNFRGSAGYGDAWFKNNGFKSWRAAISDVNDAGRWLTSSGIAAPGKLAIFGWSYGGYAALQSAVLDPNLFKAIVAVAPVTDLDMLREESRNYTNFSNVDAFIGRGPHVREGSPLQNVASIKAPVLMFHGDKDLNVGVRESVVMDQKLRGAGKASELVLFKGLNHQLDDTAARTDMLRRSDAFLRKSLGL